MRKKQVNESKQLIINGFFSLLREKNYNSITMSDIANKSLISRMTLYRHFNEKEKIFKYYMDEIVIKDIRKRFIESEEKNLSKLLLVRNQIIYENENLRIILGNEGIEVILEELLDYNKDMFLEYLPYSEDDNEYLRLFISGGLENITKEWIKNGMLDSPESITKEIISIIDLIKQQ